MTIRLICAWPCCAARTLAIPECAFAQRVKAEALPLSHEHREAVWLSPAEDIP
ncbi:MAG: hypothetical protein ACI4ML_00355 [Aristaeellaceae bacterium]